MAVFGLRGVYQCLWNPAGQNIAGDEYIYAKAGWLYVHGDFAHNWEHPPTAKYIFGIAQVVVGHGTIGPRLVVGVMVLAGGVILLLWLRVAVGWWVGLTAAALWWITPRAAPVCELTGWRCLSCTGILRACRASCGLDVDSLRPILVGAGFWDADGAFGNLQSLGAYPASCVSRAAALISTCKVYPCWWAIVDGNLWDRSCGPLRSNGNGERHRLHVGISGRAQRKRAPLMISGQIYQFPPGGQTCGS